MIANGALLVASHMLVEFGAFAFLRVQTFTTAIYEEFDLEFNSATGVSLAPVLLALCLLLLALEARMKGSLRRYARVGSGTRRAPPQIRLGVWQLPAAAALLTMVATGVGVPVVTLLYWVTSGRSQAAVGEMATATSTTIWPGALGQSGYLALVRVYPLRVPVALFEPRRFGMPAAPLLLRRRRRSMAAIRQADGLSRICSARPGMKNAVLTTGRPNMKKSLQM